MERTGLLDLAIAPLTWLERARGWRRWGLGLLYLGASMLGGVIGWRELSLWRLPKAPEPFDVVRLGRVEVADSDNAMVAYRAMVVRTGELNFQGYDVDQKAWSVSNWSVADPETRRWAEDHRHVLPDWLSATDRRDSLLVQPGSMEMGTILAPIEWLRRFLQLALLEGSRLEQDGDLQGAWKYYRSALRASRHVGMHGGMVQRLVGNSFLKQANLHIGPWLENPKVTSALLRRSIADVEACAAMTSPASEMVRAEYFVTRAALATPELWRSTANGDSPADPEWYVRITGVRWSQRFLRHEPERTRRVLRLITAGYLAQCDQPSQIRPKLLFPVFMIYDHDKRTPPDVRSITPEELNKFAKGSAMDSIGTVNIRGQVILDAEPGTFDALRLRMAERAFEIDHGKPPKTYGELLGPYLKALPEGFGPGDPTGAGSSPAGN